MFTRSHSHRMTHTHIRHQDHTHTLCFSLLALHTPHSRSFTRLHARPPSDTFLTHPGATLRGHPAGVMLRDPHLSCTSHILSHPHSLSGSDSSSIQHTRSPKQPSRSGRQQPAGAGLGGGPPARCSRGTRWRAPCRLGPGAPPTSLLHLGLPLFPLWGRRTDTRTHARTLPRSAPCPSGSPTAAACSSLWANVPVYSPSWRWLESDK